MSDANTELLVRMTEALGELREQMVFVGGCATSLLITDPAAAHERMAKRGANAGKAFWGCTGYPDYRGIRAVG